MNSLKTSPSNVAEHRTRWMLNQRCWSLSRRCQEFTGAARFLDLFVGRVTFVVLEEAHHRLTEANTRGPRHVERVVHT